MSDDGHRKTCEVSEAAKSLAEHCNYVTRHNTRIEITHPGGDGRCVLMSKRELDALERAAGDPERYRGRPPHHAETRGSRGGDDGG